MKETKFICPNCGAELNLPKNGYTTTGTYTVVGQDSGLGTHLLDMKCGGHDAPELSTKDKIKQYSVLLENLLKEEAEKNPTGRKATGIQAIIENIHKASNIYIPQIEMRWIPSQLQRMVWLTRNYKQYHKSVNNIINGYGVCYSWQVLISFLKRSMGKNKTTVEFYKPELAVKMVDDFLRRLDKHMRELRSKKMHKCKGRKYIELKVNSSKYNWGRGVYESQISTLLYDVRYSAMCVKNAVGTKNMNKVIEACESFYKNHVKVICFSCSPAQEFVNVYKACGSYYTMRDLIRFHGYRVRRDGFSSDERFSLSIVDERVKDMDFMREGYKMLGFLEEFLEYNNWDYDKVRSEWMCNK